jgi:hypothetical protein
VNTIVVERHNCELHLPNISLNKRTFVLIDFLTFRIHLIAKLEIALFFLAGV